MSTSVTSPSSASARQSAAEAPTFPAPTTLILGTGRLAGGATLGFPGRHGLRLRVDRDLHAALAPPRELHDAVLQREQRVVLAAPHVQSRGHRGAALADNDVPRADPLAAEPLHAQTLRRGVAAVLAAGYSLFMRHDLLAFPDAASRCPGSSPA